jgi:hypothetical protein
LHNLTVTFDASRLVFDNGTLFSESQQEVGYQDAEGNWSWTNRTIAGFVDTDGDGVYNPDAMPFDLELATELTGPRPRELQVGDRYKAQNFYGFELRYTVKRTDTAPLQLPGGTLDVTGVIAEAITNTTAGYAHHWMWVVQDGPLPGLVYEESRYLWFPGYGGGPHDWYRNIVAVDEY